MYQVLARKYRPRNFNELVGQNHVSRALTSALERGRLHHAYLFTGTRGVGKTTIARILAKCLNCETGVTSTPCESCATCKAVNEGRFIDLIEIDAASRTKVEDTRELLDNVPYAPTQGRYKVYLIDEVHMLSTHSFNALLKTLEEPPAHVKFLFATTDPQKLPITVISRCLQFTLRPLLIDEISSHLSQILNTEQIEAETDALWQIAEAAQGSLRDALSLTDQAIAYGQGAIHHQDVKEMLGLIDRSMIYDLILAIHQNNKALVSQLLLQFRQQALDVALVLDQLISTLHELALMQYLPDLSLKYSSEINQKITQLAGVISAQDLQLYYQIACKGRADLQIAVTQEQGFEMTVLRLLAFRPLALNQVSAAALQQQPSQMTQTVVAQAQPTETVSDVVEQRASTAASTLTERAESPATVQERQAQLEPASEPLASMTEFDQHQSVQAVAPAGIVNEQVLVEPALEIEAEQPILEQAPDVQDDPVIESASHALALTSFSHDESPVTVPAALNVAAMSEQELFFLAPVVASSTETGQSSADQLLETSVHTTVVEMNAEVVETTVVAVEKVVENANEGLMPQQILTLAEQQLEGQWDVHKWEYWFRNSRLSPAVQELAQQGLMTGEINGKCVFQIPARYEKLFGQTQQDLQQALIQLWPETHFSVEYQEIASVTPYILLQQRKQHAYVRAVELLEQEPVVKQLLETFSAELHQVQLKSSEGHS